VVIVVKKRKYPTVRTSYKKVGGKRRAGIKVGAKWYKYDRRITRSKWAKKVFGKKIKKY